MIVGMDVLWPTNSHCWLNTWNFIIYFQSDHKKILFSVVSFTSEWDGCWCKADNKRTVRKQGYFVRRMKRRRREGWGQWGWWENLKSNVEMDNWRKTNGLAEWTIQRKEGVCYVRNLLVDNADDMTDKYWIIIFCVRVPYQWKILKEAIWANSDMLSVVRLSWSANSTNTKHPAHIPIMCQSMTDDSFFGTVNNTTVWNWH